MNDDAVRQQPLVVLFDPESLATEAMRAALRAVGYGSTRLGDPGGARAALERDSPAALVIVEGRSGADDAGLGPEAKGRGIPVLGLIDDLGDVASLAGRLSRYDAWAHRDGHPAEISARLVEALARRNGDGGAGPAKSGRHDPPPAIDVGLIGMIIHDVRNPLNVIGLTLRVLEQLPPDRRADIQDDLKFLQENANQIERLMVLLSHFCRLFELPGPPDPMPIEPAPFVEDILAVRAYRTTEKAYPARFEVRAGTPDRVVIDPARTKLALLAALMNAAGAADRPIAVEVAGAGDRWTIGIAVDKAPPTNVAPFEARPDQFERLIASPAERKAFDLAIAAWIVRGLGGSVRLDVVPGHRTTIVIDLPVRPG